MITVPKNQEFRSKNQVFPSTVPKSHYAASVNSMVDGKNMCPATVFIALTFSWLIVTTEGLYDNVTLLISDTGHGRGFRAFLNNHIDRAYFYNNKDKEKKLRKK